MRSYLAAAFCCLLFLYTPASAADITVLRSDVSQWPDVTMIVEGPESPGEAAEYTLAAPGVRPVTASRLTELTEEARPASLVVAVDTSRSLSPAHLEAIKKSLAGYVETLDQGEQIALLAFNDTVQLATGFTADREAFVRNLDKLRPAGTITELNRAMLYGVELLKNLPGRRTLFVLTDGKDEGSRVSRDEVIATAGKHDVRIFAIGIPALPARENERYQGELEALGAATGGTYRAAATAADLGAATRELLAAQRSTGVKAYALTFDMAGLPIQSGRTDMTFTHSREGRIRQEGVSLEVPGTGGREAASAGSDTPPSGGRERSATATDASTAFAARGFIALLAQPEDGSGAASATAGPEFVTSPLVGEPGMVREQTGPTVRGVVGGTAVERTALGVAEGLATERSITSDDRSVAPAALENSASAAEAPARPDESAMQRYWPWILGAILALLLLFLLAARRKALNEREGRGEPLVLDFPALNRSYVLRPGTTLLGSGADNDIPLDSPGIAAIQAEFCTAEECTVRTLLASDTVKVNGKTLDGPKTLKPGDYLDFDGIKAVIRHPVLHEDGTSAVGEREKNRR